MPEQIVIVGAGLPGAANSYYSAEQTLVTPGDIASPPVAAYTLVPDIGFLFFEDLGATQSVVILTDDSPATYLTLIAAGAQGQVWSDATNIFVKNTAAEASPEISAKYFVVAQKP